MSYMEIVRHGNAGGAAWVASGFYLGEFNLLLAPQFRDAEYLTGIAIGRVCLPFVNAIVGESRVVLIYIIIAAALQAVSWAVKSFVAVRIISHASLAAPSTGIPHLLTNAVLDGCCYSVRGLCHFDILYRMHPHCVSPPSAPDAHYGYGHDLQYRPKW